MSDAPSPAGTRFGRATRFPRDGGVELWRFAREDRRVQEQLADLGARGIGGFRVAGFDEQGLWLRRFPPGPALMQWVRSQSQVRWRDAADPILQTLDALAHCEAAGLSLGVLRPSDISYDGDVVELRAPDLVATLAGAPASSGTRSGSSDSSDSSVRWVPPEVAGGAAWTPAAHRYVVGLLLYRMLAGKRPFGGRGLRLSLDRAARGAPPFEPEVASTLPPGLQSLCLRLLEGRPEDRPPSSAEVAQRLRAFLTQHDAGDSAAVAAESVLPAPATAAGSHATASTQVRHPDPRPIQHAGGRDASQASPGAKPRPRRSRVPGLLAAALLLAAPVAGYQLTPTAPVASKASTPVGPSEPLVAGTTAPEDCAECHPRQAAQWRRSVMGFAAKSPLFQALEQLIEEQVGRSKSCPHGAGILRRGQGKAACRDPNTGRMITGSGGALWCVNCHTPRENLEQTLAPWDGHANDPSTRRPLRDMLPSASMEGIDCAFCHQVQGPVPLQDTPGDMYRGNPSWQSPQTGATFAMRPEDAQGRPGIANSGYALAAQGFLAAGDTPLDALVPGGAHRRTSAAAREYLRSSEFCGACHDVRLFGADAIGQAKGEQFHRLRNAYSEWYAWAEDEREAGRSPASCLDCHMSTFPGVCVPEAQATPGAVPPSSAQQRACPPGTVFSARPPGVYPKHPAAQSSGQALEVTTHYFSGVDVPLTAEFDESWVHDSQIDSAGIPLGADQRRDLLLGSTFRFAIDGPTREGGKLRVPIVLENIGAGHRVPAGFSQEREFWVHLRVTTPDDRVVYEVGRIERGDEDLRDKTIIRVNVDPDSLDDEGRPLGLFGADVADGPEEPHWQPVAGKPNHFLGHGLINLQNGFLRCVTCIGRITPDGRCEPLPHQRGTRAARYADGAYNTHTGHCGSNLRGEHRFLEVYFPVGALDASRGVLRGPDAIIDTRSAAPSVPQRYTYEIDLGAGDRGALNIEARLMFRAFPPFLIRAFAEYEANQVRAGNRPSGPLLDASALKRLHAVELNVAQDILR